MAPAVRSVPPGHGRRRSGCSARRCSSTRSTPFRPWTVPATQLRMVYAVAGQPAEARRLLTAYEASVPEGVRRGNWGWYRATGWLALAEGRPQDAVAAFIRGRTAASTVRTAERGRKASPSNGPTSRTRRCRLPACGRSRDRAGRSCRTPGDWRRVSSDSVSSTRSGATRRRRSTTTPDSWALEGRRSRAAAERARGARADGEAGGGGSERTVGGLEQHKAGEHHDQEQVHTRRPPKGAPWKPTQ